MLAVIKDKVGRDKAFHRLTVRDKADVFAVKYKKNRDRACRGKSGVLVVIKDKAGRIKAEALAVKDKAGRRRQGNLR